MLSKLINSKYDLENTFVHRNAFMHLCDFVYTKPGDSWIPEFKGQLCNVTDVQKNNVIFVTPYCIDEFLEEIHPKINHEYILISYCHGTVLSQKKYIDDPKILAWFGATNRDAITFKKFTPIPLGIFCNDALFNNRDNTINLINKLKNNKKDKMLYMNIAVHEWSSSRKIIYDFFKNKNYCETVTLTQTWRKPWEEYMVDLSKSKFIVSPVGDMVDCYRHWESMIVGSIPIIESSPLDGILSDLPALIIDGDYSIITEEFLTEKYKEILSKKFNTQKLYMKHWSNLINEKKI